ncbi:hypothetical protein AB0K18_34445 [Nonomuraea sp. NPDC049421]|uniref:hypothetical protein n=1 Tax=Nonomuraea sp. NPDC049421 TaxID=3155275 RepID=UPI003448BF7A
MRAMVALPTRAEVEAHFEELLRGDMTREEVDRWAAQFVAADMVEGHDEPVWEALMHLCGVDLRSGPDEDYFHDDEQIAEWLDEFRRRARVERRRD